MINEQRWKTNYIGLSEAGNCFYENVNCVCQADIKEGWCWGGGGVGVGGGGGGGGWRGGKRYPRGSLIESLLLPHVTSSLCLSV